MGKKYGFSFSWKRASGISGAKGRISKKTGIPLSKSGRQRKVGRAAGCYVATVTYGDYDAVEVQFLRAFRDDILQHNFYGQCLVKLYYKIGPYFAAFVDKSTLLKKISRKTIGMIIRCIEMHTFLKLQNFKNEKQ